MQWPKSFIFCKITCCNKENKDYTTTFCFYIATLLIIKPNLVHKIIIIFFYCDVQKKPLFDI